MGIIVKFTVKGDARTLQLAEICYGLDSPNNEPQWGDEIFCSPCPSTRALDPIHLPLQSEA
jgi:hypothetical protein